MSNRLAQVQCANLTSKLYHLEAQKTLHPSSALIVANMADMTENPNTSETLPTATINPLSAENETRQMNDDKGDEKKNPMSQDYEPPEDEEKRKKLRDELKASVSKLIDTFGAVSVQPSLS